MSDSQSSEVTHGQLEISLDPDVTASQQLQITQDQEEQEIDVVGIDVVEHKTPEAETSGMKLGNEDTLQQSQPNTNTNPQEPAVVVNHPRRSRTRLTYPGTVQILLKYTGTSG